MLEVDVNKRKEKSSVYFDFGIIAFNVEVCEVPAARKIRQERKIYPSRSEGDMVPARPPQIQE